MTIATILLAVFYAMIFVFISVPLGGFLLRFVLDNIGVRFRGDKWFCSGLAGIGYIIVFALSIPHKVEESDRNLLILLSYLVGANAIRHVLMFSLARRGSYSRGSNVDR